MMENGMYMINRIEGLDVAFKKSVALELEKVSSSLRERAIPKYKGLKEIILDVIGQDGKMMRPLLVIISAHFGHYESEKIVNVATGIEMLHMATLIHDDIIDDANKRRGQASVQSKYGKDMAVYAGDYLLAKSLRTGTKESYDPELISKMSTAIERICESELIQYQNRFKVMTLKNYLRVIAGKTAALFAMSMYAGAVEAKTSESLAKQLGRIGYEIGMAFQIIDDTLDFSKESDLVGKTIENDLKKGYYTLPVIYSVQGEALNADSNPETLSRLVFENKGIEKSKILAQKYTKKAFKRIEKLPEGEAKIAVKGIAEMLLSRNY